MNRPIIALKEMINISETTPQFNASLKSRAACTARHILLALLLLTTGATSAWAQEPPVFSQWSGTAPAIPANTNKATVNTAGIEGDGTSGSPFLIDSADDFAFFWAAACNGKISSSTQYWRLDANIDLNNQTWTYVDKNGTFKGKFDGNGKIIKNMTLTTNAANKCFGLFPQVQGENATKHAEIKNLTISGFTISTPDKNTSYGATTNVGLLAGKLNGNVDIENVTVSGGTIAYNVTTTGANNVGCLAGQITSDNNTVTRCTVNNGAAITTASGDDAAKKKDFQVGGLAGNVGNNTLIKDNTVTVSITLNGETSGSNYAGGLIGYASGSNSTVTTELPMGKRIVVKGNTVTPTIAMNGVVATATLSVGGFIGYINNHVNVFNNKVTSPNISVTNDINNNSYVGGAIGFMGHSCYVDGMTLSNGSISGPTSADQIVKNNIVFFVGGFLGYQNNSGTGVFQANKFKNVAVTDMNINLGRYVAGGNIQNTKFGIGGIAGSVNQPNMQTDGSWNGMPENIIFTGGKIYAPYATTSPTVSSFNASNPAHNTMTLDAVTTVDAIEKAKVKTWYYSDYKLGLSSAFLSCESVIAYGDDAAKDKYHKNYTTEPDAADANGIRYLTVNGSTFQKQNRFQDSERDSKTVLWWTRTDNYNATTAAPFASFTDEEQPIYPNNGAVASTAYPYYWYFFQGVSNANYANATDAGNIILGITANIDNDVMPAVAVGTASNLTVTITNDGATRRGFDARNLTVKVMQGETDVTSNYTYQWYVDGVADGTAGATTSKSFTAHWKDTKGITINVIKDGTAVYATASYGFGPGVLHTKASLADASAEAVRSDINGRGTKENPYIIDCESALRQLSLLSTSHTNTLWEGVVKPVSPFPTNQIAGHYNRAYYELGADITMSATPFVPISHVGYGGDGTWGTYNTSWIFQGVLDGKGHKISNLKITWGAGQYNGNNTNIYYGLFGAVGNTAGTAAAVVKWGESAASNTIIKNLVIDGATLTHDVNNTTFSYRKNYSHITSDNGNNCMVGVLAGVVGGYTTVQNIEIRGSKITDETTTSDYSLAKMGLYVGGAIGSVQCAFNQTGNVPAGTDIRHIAAQVNITLTHPAFACDALSQKAQGEVGLFNVGGIIGRYIATNATTGQPDATMPKYTLYSGTINAPKAWISPVLGALRYKDQNGGNFGNYSKQWEGNNNTAASQVKIDNALFYDFYIGASKVTDIYPSNNCGLGARAIILHTDGSDAEDRYNAQGYQGVNYGAKYVERKGLSLELLNKERTDGYSIVWDTNPGTFMHLSTDTYLELSLSRDAKVSNKFTAEMEGVASAPETYKWEVSFIGDDAAEHWYEIAGVTGNEYTVPVSLKTKYVRASTTVNEKTYTTLIEIVDADRELCKPKITSVENAGKTETTFTFNLNQKVTDPAATLTTTYQWYSTKTDIIEGKTAQTLTLDNTTLSSYNNIVWCKAVVSELDEVIETYFIISGATVIYVNGNGYTEHSAGEGSDSNDGKTPQTPVKTLNKANSLLKTVDAGGTMDNNVIVIMGTLNSDADFRSTGTNPATLTGEWDEIDYEGVIKIKQIDQSGGENIVNKVSQSGQKGSNCYVLGDTKFQYLTFQGDDKTKGNNFIECHGNDVWFGKGLKMTNFRNLGKDHGNLNTLQNIPELTIILTATNLCEADIQKYTNREKPQVLTIESGRYGRIMGGRYTNGFFAKSENTSHTILGSAAHPVWAVVNIDIDKGNPNKGTINRHEAPKGDVSDNYTLDINCIIAGLTDGSMYGDYQINVHGGRIGYIVGGNQGNPVANAGTDGGPTYTMPESSTSGKWGQWPNATYFGRTVINIEQDDNLAPIKIDNVYAGGLGRMKNGSDAATTVVDMYLYGRTEVNMKSGTVLGNVYAGGAGGVIGINPWDAHVPYATVAEDKNADGIANNVQYGKFGSAAKSAGDPLAKVTLHNLKDDGTYDIEYLDLEKSSTTLNISGDSEKTIINGSVYGGGYGFVSNMTSDVCMQGVGSVFGTTNVNISGGTIDGSVYGGSQGHSFYYGKQNNYGQTIDHIAEMNGTVNMHLSGSPKISGDIFGAGQGVASSASLDYNRIATTGNVDLAGGGATEEQKNKYKSTVNIVIDLDKNTSINNVYGGGKLGCVDGNTNVVFNSGQINGNVYGGGRGENGHLNKARVNGTTNVTIGY